MDQLLRQGARDAIGLEAVATDPHRTESRESGALQANDPRVTKDREALRVRRPDENPMHLAEAHRQTLDLFETC